MVSAIRREKFRMSTYSRAMIFGPLSGIAIIEVGSYFFGPNPVTLAIGMVAVFVIAIRIARRG